MGTWIESFLFSILRVSTPIIFAAQAAVICQKCGLMNLAIESMMLWGALAVVLVSGFVGSAWVGLLAAILVGTGVAMIISYAAFVGKADLYLTNIAVNLATAGGTMFVLYIFTGDKANSAGTIVSQVLPSINIPLLEKIPFLGDVLSGHNVLTYLAILSPFVMRFLIYKTRLGLRIRSVGENPRAAESVGVSVVKVRFLAYMLSGALAAMGGAYLSAGYLSSFTKNMTAGRGFIGFAASNMVGGSPVASLFTALLFGTADAASSALQTTNVITDFVQMIPYAVTIISLVIISVSSQRKTKHIKHV